MSKKNIARSALEGGRAGSNKWDRRRSSKLERVKSRQYLTEVVRDLEYSDEIIEPTRKPVYKEFTDKLNPMYRWLETQVGRPWSEVRSEVFQKFDTRTTAGRHILFDHLLPQVVDSESGYDKYGVLVNPDEETLKDRESSKKYRFLNTYSDYYVDENDILCKVVKKKYTYERITEKEYADAGSWLNGRMIVNKGGVLSWCVPSEGIWKSSWFEPYKTYELYGFPPKLRYYFWENGLYQLVPTTGGDFYIGFTGKTHGDHWEEVAQPFSFRQRGPLTKDEVKIFKSLRKKIQKEILDYSKGR